MAQSKAKKALSKGKSKSKENSKNYGMIVLIAAIILVAALTVYVITDGVLMRTSLLKDKSFISSVSEILKKFPANISQKDLDKVKVLTLTADIKYFEKNSYYGSQGYTLSFGYDDALELIRKQEADALAQENDPNYVRDESLDSHTVDELMLSVSSEINIADFSSLSCFKNVEYLIISGPNLNYLYYYSMYGMNVDYSLNPMKELNNVNFIANMPLLTNVNIYNIPAEDFSAFKNITSIKNLSIQGCKIKDAGVFADLTNLETLNLSGTNLENISFISSFAGLRNLYLSGNAITDITPVQNLAKLKNLSFEANQIENASVLNNLVSLKSLNLNSNKIKNADFLTKLTALESLSLSDNEIAAIPGLSSLASLKSLDISDNQLTEISGIENCKSLETLNINDNGTKNDAGEKLTAISDLSPVSKLTALDTLYADGNNITDISPIAPLKETLKTLSLKNNKITSISVLKDFYNLATLNLDGNMITDFSPISELEAAGSASISGQDNQITENGSNENENVPDGDIETPEE